MGVSRDSQNLGTWGALGRFRESLGVLVLIYGSLLYGQDSQKSEVS